MKARRDIKGGVETRGFSFHDGPEADALVGAAERAKIVVSSVPREHDEEDGLDATFRTSVLDQRPRGVVVVCRRRFG